MSFLVLFYIVLSSFLCGSTPVKAQEWESIESEKFIVNYLDYLSDAEWVLEQLEIASTIVQNVYPHTLTTKIIVYLYLVPNENASWYTTALSGNALHFMTPTLGKENGGPWVDDMWYQSAIIHEYVHVPFYNDVNYNPPGWFSQGIAEYVGMFRANIVGTLEKAQWQLEQISNMVKNGDGYLASVTGDVYYGGAYLLKYMYEVYGQDAVVRVIRSDATSFWQALTTELNVTIREFEDYWLIWACSEFEADPELYPTMESEYPVLEPEEEPTTPPLPPLPPILSNLTITPAEIESGDEVTITFTITNIDSQTFTYTTTMQIGELTLFVDVELGAYESETVQYIMTPDAAGDYNVTVDGMTGSFTVKAPPKPAEFEFSNLRIFYPGVIPPEEESSQTMTVIVSIEAENVGESAGGHTVELKVDGEVIDSKEVTLEGAASETVLFELTRGAGTYDVEVEGFTESFTVNTQPEPEPEQRGIPGFPYMSIILGLLIALVLHLRNQS